MDYSNQIFGESMYCESIMGAPNTDQEEKGIADLLQVASALRIHSPSDRTSTESKMNLSYFKVLLKGNYKKGETDQTSL